MATGHISDYILYIHLKEEFMYCKPERQNRKRDERNVLCASHF